MPMRYGCILGFCALVAGWPLALADDGHPLGLNKNHPYGIISNAYETPHVKWAVPYAGGTIDALVLAPQWSQRETVELAQRLSLNYTAWMSETFTQITAPAASDPAFGYFQPPPAVVYRQLRECARKDYDVIIVGKLDWAMMPAEHRLQLLEKVSMGTGLVYVNPPAGNKELGIVFGGKRAPGGRDFISVAVPIAALPRFTDKSAERLITTSMFDKGRVVVLDYGEEIPAKHAQGWPCLTPQWDLSDTKTGYVAPDQVPEIELVPYEYYHALVARAAIWASKRTPETGIGEIQLGEEITWPASAGEARVALRGDPGGKSYRVAVRSRWDYARVYTLPSLQADKETALSLPDLCAGEYFLDVWLMTADGRQVMDWSSRAFSVVADVGIDGLILDNRGYDPGDTIGGRVELSRALTGDEHLVAELWDNHGRKLQERKPTLRGTEIGFSFSPIQPLTILHRVRLKVFRQSSELARQEVNFPIRARLGWDEFNEVTWCGAENQFITHAMLRKLDERDQSGAVDVGWRGATNARNIAAANLAAVPYTAGFGHFGNYKGHVVPTLSGARAKNGCMSNPGTLKAVDQWGATQSDIYGPYGPLAWTHGDECFYARDPDVCWSETCLKAFREYLQEIYSDLSALNRQWRTSYTDWSEVKPITYEQAKSTGNYAPWLEHRISAGRVFARLYGRTGQALSKNDPGARPGFDGPQALPLPNGGINWWMLKDHVGILQDYIYNSESMEIFRSFATPGHLSGMWYGTYGLTWQIGPNTAEFHHFFPWYSMLHGLNSTWFWTMGAPGPLSGYAPDLTNLPFFDASRQSLKEIRSGIFQLVRTGQRANDGIAIHYSEISRIADSLYSDDKRCRAWMESLADFNHAIEDSGLQYEYVSHDEIEQGQLRKGQFRVLIMPHNRAVSAAEAKAIRQFVQNGGLLIADIMPGILNGHGARQKQSLLADLFPKTDSGAVNAIGKGKTVLLGEELAGYGYASYRNMQGWKKLEGRSQILAKLLKQHADVTPQVRISHRGDGEMPPTEIVRFEVGEVEFVGLLRNYFLYDNTSYPVEIRFADERHVYDVRAGKYLGFRDSLTTALSYQAHVYARLPYKVKSIVLDVPELKDRITPSLVKVALKTSSDKPASGHAFQMQVLSPNDTELPWYTRKVVAAEAEAEVEIPWALNDAPGRYTVVVRDVASGVTARQEVSLP